MWFTPNNEMIETLAPDRSDQPFSEAILPRRSRCDGLVPDAHGTPFEAGFRPSAKPGFLLQRSIFAYCLGQKRTLPPLKTYCAGPRVFLGRRYSVGELAKYGVGLHQ